MRNDPVDRTEFERLDRIFRNLQDRIGRLENQDVTLAPLYNTDQWPQDAVEGQIVIADAFGAPPSEDIPLGGVSAAPLTCGAYWVVQDENTPDTYRIPAGDWLVTQWSCKAGHSSSSGNTGGYQQLVMFRHVSGFTYTVIGKSPMEALTPDVVNTYTLATPIAVQGGDLIGLGCNFSDCGEILSDYGYGTANGNDLSTLPAVGSNATSAWSNLTFRINVAILIVPA